MSKTTATDRAASRRRMRIKTVIDEWVRNPSLCFAPGIVVVFAALADLSASDGMYALASSFALLSHVAVAAIVALLGVAIVRL